MSQLDEIEARRADCQTYNFGMRNADKLAKEDVPYLLALVREQQAQIERVQALADKLDRFGANTRAMNPTRHGGWEGKARDFERQAIAIRAALEARP